MDHDFSPDEAAHMLQTCPPTTQYLIICSIISSTRSLQKKKALLDLFFPEDIPHYVLERHVWQ